MESSEGSSGVEHSWLARRNPLFSSLYPQQVSEIESAINYRDFSKGSAIYSPGDQADHLCLLERGRVKLCSTSASGKQAILRFVESGEIFGELAIVGQTQREEIAEAAADTRVALLPVQRLRPVVRSNSDFAFMLMELIATRRRAAERRVKSLLFHSSRDRLIHLLTELAQQYGAVEGGAENPIRMSHLDVASIIGSTRETVTTLLGELQLQGLIRVKRQRIEILDYKALTAEAALPA